MVARKKINWLYDSRETDRPDSDRMQNESTVARRGQM